MRCFSWNLCFFFFIFLSSMAMAGRLELNPKLVSVTKLAGDDKSFFISCIPFSAIGAVGDSRIRAKELSWKKKQKPPIGNNWVVMGSEQYSRVHVEQSADARGLDLVFRSIQVDDEGEYSCEAIIDGRAEQQIFFLKVIEPISFEGTDRVQSVEDGSAFHTLICKVSGNPQPQVTWNVRGNTVRIGFDDGKHQVTSDGLVIRNITQADRGAYKCKAIQIDEEITDFQEMIIELRVQHEPKWVKHQRSIFYAFISGTANLTCQANAEPPATFSWYDKHERPIQKGTILSEKHISTLMLPVTHDDIFGEYTCKASNKMGTLMRKVRLSEGAKPGIPTLEIHKINTESVELTILVNQQQILADLIGQDSLIQPLWYLQEHPAELHLRIVGFEIEYKEKHLDWDLAYHEYFPSSSSNLYKVRGLMPKTFYHFRARARNLAGYSDHSNVVIYLQTSAPHAVGELLGSSSANTSQSVINLASSLPTLLILLILLRTF